MLTSSPAVTYDGMGKIDTVTSAGCPATAEPESGEDKYVASVVVVKNMEHSAERLQQRAGRRACGHWGYTWARWVRTGTVTGSGSGETKAAAESAAAGDARSKAAGSLSGISYSTSKTTETVVTVTADYTWVQYRGQEAAAQPGVGVGTDDESDIPAHEPEPE